MSQIMQQDAGIAALMVRPDLISLAGALRRAEVEDAPIAPLRDRVNGAQEAYAIQAINAAHRVSKGARIVGRKIGLTNPAVQAQLGVDQPDYGVLFADTEIDHGGAIRYRAGAQFKIEAELAFVLGRDLPAPDCSGAEVLRAVEYVVPSIEIVGSRIADWDIRFVDTVADNASSACFTLGASARRVTDVDMLDCRMTVRNAAGTVVSQGSGRACLGSPLNALRWLARRMAALGTPLKEGEVILSGALGPMVTVTGEDLFTAQIDGFGSSAIRFIP